MKVEQSFSINLSITSTQSGEVVNFPEFPTLSVPSGLTLVSQKLEMINLQAKVSINSQTPLILPSIPLDASSSDIALIGNNLAWDNPRLQMDLLLGNSGNWNAIATESLIDVSPVPFRLYDLLANYGQNPSIIDPGINLAVRVYDVGYGGLQSTDSIVIWGDFLLTSYIYVPQTGSSLTVNETTPTINVNVTESSSSSGSSGSTTPTDINDVALIAITTNYQIQANDRIYLDSSAAQVTVTVPQNPTPLEEFEIIFGPGYGGFVNFGSVNYLGNEVSTPLTPETYPSTSQLQGGKFVYINSSIGWINEPDNTDVLLLPGY